MTKNVRKYLVIAHLLFAGFMAPMFIMLSISGGLYLIGNKGDVNAQALVLPATASLDFKSETLEDDVRALLKTANIEHEFEYVKNRGSLIQLRPTSRTYIEIKQTPDGLAATRNVPDFQKSMIELHKGHGPTLFKTYQKLVAITLFLVVFGGLLVGFLSPTYRRKTVLSTIAGMLVFLALALFA